jgi:hypothetical protein
VSEEVRCATGGGVRMKSGDRIGSSRSSLGSECRGWDSSSLARSKWQEKVRRREDEALRYCGKGVGRFGRAVGEDSPVTLCCFAWVTLCYARFRKM